MPPGRRGRRSLFGDVRPLHGKGGIPNVGEPGVASKPKESCDSGPFGEPKPLGDGVALAIWGPLAGGGSLCDGGPLGSCEPAGGCEVGGPFVSPLGSITAGALRSPVGGSVAPPPTFVSAKLLGARAAGSGRDLEVARRFVTEPPPACGLAGV